MRDKQFCAHRGVSALMPENTLPAFAAALSLGADEIEMDVRLTSDGKLVVSHDGTLERISDGKGALSEKTLKELKALNVGGKHGWLVRFCTPEEVFSLLGGQITFNIHLKEHGEDGCLIRELCMLADKYYCRDSIYFAGSPAELEWMEKVAPDIPRTAIQLPGDEIGIYEMAMKYHCSGVQLWFNTPEFQAYDKELIEKLHEKDITVNLFYADDAESYKAAFDMGVDTILTNRMDLAAQYRREHRKEMRAK